MDVKINIKNLLCFQHSARHILSTCKYWPLLLSSFSFLFFLIIAPVFLSKINVNSYWYLFKQITYGDFFQHISKIANNNQNIAKAFLTLVLAAAISLKEGRAG